MDDLGDLLAHSRMVVPEIARRVVELKVLNWVFLRCGSFKRMRKELVSNRHFIL